MITQASIYSQVQSEGMVLRNSDQIKYGVLFPFSLGWVVSNEKLLAAK